MKCREENYEARNAQKREHHHKNKERISQERKIKYASKQQQALQKESQ